MNYIAAFPATKKTEDGDAPRFGTNMLETIIEYVAQYRPHLLDTDKHMKACRKAEALSPNAIQVGVGHRESCG